MALNKKWFEILYPNFGQYFSVENIIYYNKNLQELIIFENNPFGRILALDGIVQTTELDEFIYHEMLTHIPLLSYNHPKNILIIGGGDGATLREVTKYRSIENITLVEIDENVVTLCRKYLPKHSANAFLDPRLTLIIDDGLTFVKTCNKIFDIIIVDRTDPVGPGISLFTTEFYKKCSECLHQNGIFVAQNGVYLFQNKEIINSYYNLRQFFSDVTFYQASIPSYYGGMMFFSWASQNPKLRQFNPSILQTKLNKASLYCKYYNPEIHIGSFAIPQYISKILSN
ncbi:MAG: polyamine aminopropyltransferase [Candidatus Dasytiphilus stammeri]